MSSPPTSLNMGVPNSDVAKDRDVWLVHPWSLGDLPADLPKDSLVIGIFVSEFHRAWPWSEKEVVVCSKQNGRIGQ
jgi:deoxyribodipyrimidine photo-lyase